MKPRRDPDAGLRPCPGLPNQREECGSLIAPDLEMCGSCRQDHRRYEDRERKRQARFEADREAAA